MNQINLIGRLGQNVEFKQINPEFSSARFSIAVGEKTKKNGEYVEHTEWFVCEAYNRQAEICRDYLEKGKQVAITGKIRTDTYEKDGETKRFTKVIVNQMEMLGSKNDNSGQNGTSNESHSTPVQQNNRAVKTPAERYANVPDGNPGEDELPF